MSTRFKIVSTIFNRFSVIDTVAEENGSPRESVIVAENMGWNNATILADVLERNHMAYVQFQNSADARTYDF